MLGEVQRLLDQTRLLRYAKLEDLLSELFTGWWWWHAWRHLLGLHLRHLLGFLLGHGQDLAESNQVVYFDTCHPEHLM